MANAIVTGGGSGIGRAVALQLAQAGWRVLIAGRTPSSLEAVCKEGGEPVSFYVADVTDESGVKALFDVAMAQFGRLDLLFNNAGALPRRASVAEVELEDWSRVMDVNVTGAFLCAREAFRHMQAQNPEGGRIINNGSISALVPRPQALSYSVSKHAMTGLTRALSLEGRAFNIACGQIDIGNAATKMTAGIAAGSMQADGTIGPEPMIDVDLVAASVVHMASLPLEANVQFMTVMATRMPFIGRG